ncbi:hypothetical protein NH340_JMT07019 [Sarcoptes scabiei]|nr:hypothetical protein NH340_JMT07019 [Sarcoptes scabiei]
MPEIVPMNSESIIRKLKENGPILEEKEIKKFEFESMRFDESVFNLLGATAISIDFFWNFFPYLIFHSDNNRVRIVFLSKSFRKINNLLERDKQSKIMIELLRKEQMRENCLVIR